VSERPTLFKVLLRQRHWQSYGTFCAEYDKAARRLDERLVGTWPSRAQLHRWLSGDLKGLPYPDHCRVLEQIFPGHTAEALFSPCPDELVHTPGQLHASNAVVFDGREAPPPARFGADGVMPIVAVRPLVEAAFAQEHVRVDFSGFSGETLHGAVQEPLDKIRTGHLKPSSVHIRMLLLGTTKPWPLPCRSDDLADDPDFRARAQRIMIRHAHAVLDTIEELANLELVDEASAAVRVHDCPPSFKLYILNEEAALFGFYPITRRTVTIEGSDRSMYDLMGKDTILFRYGRGLSPTGAAYVEQARTWFDSMWNTIGREHAL
jgi:hypothetical protein